LERRLAVPLLAMLIASSLISVCSADDEASVHVEGFVRGPDGAPLQNALLRLWGFYKEAEAYTDSEGHYVLDATTDEQSCQLYAFYDDPETTGYGLLPAQKRLQTDSDLTAYINFTLKLAATVNVTGQFKPMDSTTPIRKFALEVVDPVNGSTMQSGEYGLIYGTGMNVQSYFLGLDPMTIIVPADTPFEVRVSSSYQQERIKPGTYTRQRWRSRQATRVETFNKFSISEGEGFMLEAGEVACLDVRRYSLLADMTRIEPLIGETDANLTVVESSGFYVAAERYDLQTVKELLSGLAAKIENLEYEGAYVDLRQAYLKLMSVRMRLETLVLEASLSVNLLLLFIAFTAVALGAMLTESAGLRLLLTAVAFAPMAIFIRLVYPGSGALESGRFAVVGAVSLIVAILATSVLPGIFGDTVGGRGLAGLGALVAVFSMGKRSLKRRRLRSLFTFTTIMTLTMSFVALTSLSTSYGLVYNRSGTSKPVAEGIMVREPEYKPNSEFEKGWFIPIIPPVLDWAWENEGVVNVAQKADSTPSLRPYGRIGGWPIYGVIGLQPEVEPLMPMIDDAVVEGAPLREEGTCLLHRYLRTNAKIGVGDQISIAGVPMKVVGFFDDVQFIYDMDGETFLPSYQVLVSPDPPTIEVHVCDDDAVVITTLETALLIDRVLVSRIDVEIEPGTDLDTIGRSMALSREYRVWISEGGVVHLAYMGSQTAGKGLPILVPWMIVILNVVTTMLNSMFERHREIDILSSIGLNPMHIAGVFLAEASILGVLGGGVGYLVGLGLYPLMSSLAMAPVVAQKVSAVWLVAALGIAVASVIFGSMIALRGSVGLTPSLTLRWTSGDQMTSHKDVWGTLLPVRIEDGNLEEFLSYLEGYLGGLTTLDSVPLIGSLRSTEKEGARVLSFSYNERNTSISTTRTSNVIALARDEEGFYKATLESKGEWEAANKTATFIRKIVLRWSTEHSKSSGGVRVI
jgi:hypothetical protein